MWLGNDLAQHENDPVPLQLKQCLANPKKFFKAQTKRMQTKAT